MLNDKITWPCFFFKKRNWTCLSFTHAVTGGTILFILPYNTIKYLCIENLIKWQNLFISFWYILWIYSLTLNVFYLYQRIFFVLYCTLCSIFLTVRFSVCLIFCLIGIICVYWPVCLFRSFLICQWLCSYGHFALVLLFYRNSQFALW